LKIAEHAGLNICVDIYEPKDFSRCGPAGCNMCGGVISESLVQMLATEGINLPHSVVQRGISSYVLHTDAAAVRIRTPTEEMRIACVHRGCGPKGSEPGSWQSFDGYLLNLACQKGARHLPQRVEALEWLDGRPVIRPREGREQCYDLVVGAVGVNSESVKLFEHVGSGLRRPKTTRACIAEICLGRDQVQTHLGSAMHVFLLDLPRLEFAALIPKGDYVTTCVLGRDVDQQLLRTFLATPEVRACLPPELDTATLPCRCGPRINIAAARPCFGDRVVLVGDCGVSRLYKDGIGAAYRAAKACAVTAIFHGVSERDFVRYYWPTCRRLQLDNRVGKLLFLSGWIFRKVPFLRGGMLRMVADEQRVPGPGSIMSTVLWDMFTGSAPYLDILLRMLKPKFLYDFLSNCMGVLFRLSPSRVTTS
jgi:flavin-dependent dehydrogenase